MALIRGPEPPAEKRPKPIYARSGWEIPQPDSRKLAELPKQTIEKMRLRTNQLIKDRFEKNKSPIIVRSLSPYLYNCVGMIFASRRAIIEIDHIQDILRHDGYRQIKREDVMVGDIVLY